MMGPVTAPAGADRTLGEPGWLPDGISFKLPIRSLAIRPTRLTPRLFDRVLDDAPYVLIRVGRTPRTAFHPGLAEFFQRAYPGRFAFGLLNRAEIRDAGWIERAFRTALGPIRGGVGDGYYLLEGGVVIGQHSGQIRPANVSYLDEQGADALRQRVRRMGFPLGGSDHDVDAASQLVAYFDGIVARKLGGSDASSQYVYEDREASPPPGARSRAQPAPARPPSADPFEVLGVARDATDDEIKNAYREQLKLNHPDKVSHLSPALQQFATAQVLAIKAAFERIKVMRKR